MIKTKYMKHKNHKMIRRLIKARLNRCVSNYLRFKVSAESRGERFLSNKLK